MNILAIDIGGSKIIIGIVDDTGKVIENKKFLLPEKYDIDFIVDSICREAISYNSYSPVAAGISIPGLADTKTGTWVYAPFSGISNIPICDILSERLGIPSFCGNDVNLCALAEKRFGACKDKDDYVWVTVSNGIGGGLVLKGELYEGISGNAGEIGHFIVEEEDGRVCGCGNSGCLEAMASGCGIAAEYKKLTGISTEAKSVADKANEGDKTAIDVFYKSGYYIGKALSYVINILNVNTAVIGGGVAQSFELLEPGINKALERYVFWPGNKKVNVVKTGLGYYASLVGCAGLALSSINK